MRLAQGIDRRVGYLREPLFAVVPKSPRQRREKSRRRIVPHAPVGLFAAKQRGEQNLELIFCPACCSGNALAIGGGCSRRTGTSRQPALRKSIPALLNRQALQDVAPAQELPGCRIRENHFAGAEP